MRSRTEFILNVAEKPSVALAITKVLSSDFHFVTKKGAGGNDVHHFTIYRGGKKIMMRFTSVAVHLMKYQFKKSPRGRRNPDDALELFERPMEKVMIKNGLRHNYAMTLEHESLSCQKLYLWTDNDVEGANISDEIKSICCSVVPGLVIRRAIFSAINRSDILNSFDNVVPLGPDHESASSSVDVRNQIDLCLGAVLTKFQNRELNKVFVLPMNKKVQLSYGSCQFPTLGFVVKQAQLANKLKPTEKFSISVSHNSTQFIWRKKPLSDKSDVLAVICKCLEKPKASHCN